MKPTTSYIKMMSWQCYTLQYGPTPNQLLHGVDNKYQVCGKKTENCNYFNWPLGLQIQGIKQSVLRWFQGKYRIHKFILHTVPVFCLQMWGVLTIGRFSVQTPDMNKKLICCYPQYLLLNVRIVPQSGIPEVCSLNFGSGTIVISTFSWDYLLHSKWSL
jgi:hypothetical protein